MPPQRFSKPPPSASRPPHLEERCHGPLARTRAIHDIATAYSTIQSAIWGPDRYSGGWSARMSVSSSRMMVTA